MNFKDSIFFKNKLITCFILFIFIFGAVTSLIQVLLIRQILLITEGNELIIGFNLGFWLSGISIGAFCGTFLNKKKNSNSNSKFIISGILAVFVFPIISLIFLTYIRKLFHISTGVVLSPSQTILVSAIVMILSAFPSGFTFPYLVSTINKLLKDNKHTPGGIIYGGESFGALIGGILFSFLLAGRINSITIIICGCGILFIASSFALYNLSKQFKIIIFLSGLILALFGNIYGENIYRFFDQKRWILSGLPGDRKFSIDTPYQHLDLAENNGEYNLYGNGSIIYSFPFSYSSPLPVHLALLENGSNKQNILMIGGGIADRLEAALKHNPGRIDYVELDSKVIDITLPFLGKKGKELSNHSEINIINTDPIRFISSSKRNYYDVVILNSPFPINSMINRYYTVEFYHSVIKFLKHKGVAAIRIDLPGNYKKSWESKLVLSIHNSLKKVCKDILWSISPEDQGYIFCSKSKGVLSNNIKTLRSRRDKAFWELNNEITSYHLELFFPSDRIIAWNDFINKNSKTVPLNYEAHPAVYYYGLALWEQKGSDSEKLNILPKLQKIKLYHLLFILILIYIICTILKKKIKFINPPIIMFFTGFTIISLELILLLYFQNHFGSLYREIGLLIGILMAGLFIGSWKKFSKSLKKRLIIFLLLNILILISVLSAYYFISGTFVYIITIILLFLTGYITGSIFPLCIKIMENYLSDKHYSIAAGFIDGVDHLGAFLGGILTGILFIPVLGVLNSIMFLSCLQIVSILILL